MDRQTDGQTYGIAIASTALAMRALRRASIAARCKNDAKIAICAPSHEFVELYLRN